MLLKNPDFPVHLEILRHEMGITVEKASFWVSLLDKKDWAMIWAHSWQVLPSHSNLLCLQDQTQVILQHGTVRKENHSADIFVCIDKMYKTCTPPPAVFPLFLFMTPSFVNETL